MGLDGLLRANPVVLLVALAVVAAGVGVIDATGSNHVGGATQASETSVRLEPANATVTVDDTTTVDVVVEDSDGGVGAADLTVALDDGSVGSITNATVRGGPSAATTNVTVAGDGTRVRIAAALMDTNDTGPARIATVTVRGESAGTGELSLTVDALGNETGESYTVNDTRGSSLTVERRSGE